MREKMSRRDFVKSSSCAAAATLAIPAMFAAQPKKAFAGPGETMKTEDYLQHFGVTEKDIQDVIAAGLSMGGDYCDVYFQHNIYNYVGLEDKAVNRASTNIDLGVGIRVLKGDQTGYSFTEEITPKAMKLAAKTAANIASDAKKVGPVQMQTQSTPNYYPIEKSWEAVSIDQKVPLLQSVNDQTFDADPRVIKARVFLTNETSYVMIATSEGKLVCDYQPMVSLGVVSSAEQDGQRESAYKAYSARRGFEAITPEIMTNVAKGAVEKTTILFDAVKPDAGEMPVVLAPGSSGILLHEAIGHGMEADFNRKGVSIFSDKIGKKVAEDFVNIVDNGKIENDRGAVNVDDEGNPSQETVLVENGILKSYLHDRISAKHYGVASTGNGRRQSFRYAPQPRMRSTYMLNGPHDPQDIIGSVKKGLYAQEFTNGEVFIGAGDFTFYVALGYLIEDGKLTKPVKDINIIGNGPDVLSKITMVGNDLKVDQSTWTCGKNGQGKPVSQGLPTAKVSSITVGGKNS